MSWWDVDDAILWVAAVTVIYGVTSLGVGQVFGLIPLCFGLLVFAYIKVDDDRITEWLASLNDTSQETEEDPLAVLRERYAHGGIDEAEFESRLDDLLETESVERAENHRDQTPITERSE